MKKYILSLSLLAVVLMAGAAVENPNRIIVHSSNGETKVFEFDNVDYLDFDEVSDINVVLSIEEGSVTGTSFRVVAEPGSGCASYSLVLLHDGTPVKDTQTFSAGTVIPFDDLDEGATYTITATTADIYGIAGDPASLSVSTALAIQEPKVGDYFYSDGTWSDGGLISMDANGCNAVWSAEKPAPIAGKTVVGIVFNTDPDRMSAADKAAGFSRGYVIGCKNIQDPGKSNFSTYPESVWFAGQWAEASVNSVSKLSKSCYSNVIGSEETSTMFEKNDPEYYHEDIPMFYYGTTEYPVAAPEGTSGWFIPSIGQMWDCVANFCGGSVAEFLASIQDSTVDFSYQRSSTTEIPLDEFLKVFSLVPDEDKDDMTIADDGSAGSEVISLGTSTRYDTESRVIINLGMNGNLLVEGMVNWFDGEAHARPIFAF